ncbi:MAG: hypothetical protein IPM12_04065 [Flavobacteriales bacterium]|nr:hypothetical protein [Flavobacteriales bacterium]
MKHVLVTYTVTAAFEEENRRNVARVMEALRDAGHPGIHYRVLFDPEERTFVHLAHFNSAADQQLLLAMPAFQHFQQALRASGPTAPPRSREVQDVGNWNI